MAAPVSPASGSDTEGSREPSIRSSVNSERSRLGEVDTLDLRHGEAAAVRPADPELGAALLLQDAPELGAEHAPGARAAYAGAEEGALRAVLAEIVRVAGVALLGELDLLGGAVPEADQQP